MNEISCQTIGCANKDIPLSSFGILDNGTQVICGGGCNNLLRADNPEHPNYPEMPESEPTLEELVAAEVARQLGT